MTKSLPHKISQAKVDDALANCGSLLREATRKAKRRRQLCAALSRLGAQVLRTLVMVNTEFPREMVELADGMLQPYIDVLWELESKLGANKNPARKRLDTLCEALRSRIANEQVEAYNPLNLRHLATSTQAKFNDQPLKRLDEMQPFRGEGVYALYYTGKFPLYKPIAVANAANPGRMPIYVGEAGRQPR